MARLGVPCACPLAHRLADRGGKTSRSGACSEPPWLNQQDASLNLLPLAQFTHQRQRNSGGLPCTRRRLKNEAASPVQPNTELVQQWIDGEGAQQ